MNRLNSNMIWRYGLDLLNVSTLACQGLWSVVVVRELGAILM
jgi:hypothetical protein